MLFSSKISEPERWWRDDTIITSGVNVSGSILWSIIKIGWEMMELYNCKHTIFDQNQWTGKVVMTSSSRLWLISINVWSISLSILKIEWEMVSKCKHTIFIRNQWSGKIVMTSSRCQGFVSINVWSVLLSLIKIRWEMIKF